MSHVFGFSDPIELFRHWLMDAEKSEPNDPNAMTVATVDGDGRPSARIVLLRGFDAEGFSFFTNYQSRKGADIAANPHGAICIHWKSIRRQIRAHGRIIKLDDKASDEYFYARHPESQLGAWASQQSQVLDSRETMEKRMEELRIQYQGREIPRPKHWGGYKLIAADIEFWHERPHRLHDRELFVRDGHGWRANRLYP